ncbi:hypothetical protein VQH23_11175 [Pararoseomonas sp. SCSIO 73927]|uniref:hypothetical protein n=1 Tax=Pararoseomonas sp. SCSIO 73927 TaxID=3114537 RepID=UPI0030CECB56
MPESRSASPDLDVLAARRAARLFRAAVARGVPEGAAWADAVEVFRVYHPAWPLPLVEREAARVVAALIEREDVDVIARASAAAVRGVPPLRLLQDLARPAVPKGGEAEAPALEARDAWRAYAGLLNPPGLPRMAGYGAGAG